MIPEELRKWIDEASYEELLYKWRYAPVGSPYFVGEVGDYYSKKMAERRSEIGDAEAARVSKRLG